MRPLSRIILTMILVTILTNMSFAQNPIPNPGFENWTDGNPDGWFALNVPGVYVTITQTNSSHTGNYAVKGEVVNWLQTNIPPTLITGDTLISISQNYSRMTGYYQMTNMGEDALFAEVIFYDASSTPVAVGYSELGATTGGYQPFTVNMEYNPDHQAVVGAYIYFVISLESSSTMDNVTIGSSFLLDDLAFDMVSSLDTQAESNTPLIFTLAQNYPNPFNPSTTIVFSLPSSGKTLLTVYNNLGQVVERLIDEDLAEGVHQVTFNASNLPSGTYFYKLEAGSRSTVKRMMLVK